MCPYAFLKGETLLGKIIFFQGVFHPLKMRMGTYKKIRVAYFYLKNNILLIKIGEGVPFFVSYRFFLM